MNNPCDTCAFKSGSITQDEPHNHLKGIICLLGPLPFYCHHLKDGTEITNDPKYHERMTRQEIRAAGMQICAGWKREVAQLAATGYFMESPRLTKAHAMIALQELSIFLDSEDGSDDKHEANERLQHCITRLGDKRRRFEQ